MFRKGLSKAKITALAIALCMISMSLKEEGALASANAGIYYTWPVPSSSTIEKSYSKGNDGIDISGKGENIQILVARNGVVETAKSDDCMHLNNYPDYCCNNGLGNYVKIRHDDGSYATYSHLKAGSVIVSEGQKVKAGDILGYMGASGRTQKKCLHFSVAYSDNRTVNTNPDKMKYIYTVDDGASQEESETEVWSITADSGVNFRSGAGTTFKVIGRIPNKAKVEVSEKIEIENLQWGKTTYEGETGWFALKYAEVAEESKESVKEEAAEENIYVELRFDTNGGDCEYSSYTYNKGSVVGQLPMPTREDYNFVGWYTDRNEGTAITKQHIISEEMTVYAHWR